MNNKWYKSDQSSKDKFADLEWGKSKPMETLNEQPRDRFGGFSEYRKDKNRPVENENRQRRCESALPGFENRYGRRECTLSGFDLDTPLPEQPARFGSPVPSKIPSRFLKPSRTVSKSVLPKVVPKVSDTKSFPSLVSDQGQDQYNANDGGGSVWANVVKTEEVSESRDVKQGPVLLLQKGRLKLYAMAPKERVPVNLYHPIPLYRIMANLSAKYTHELMDDPEKEFWEYHENLESDFIQEMDFRYGYQVNG